MSIEFTSVLQNLLCERKINVFRLKANYYVKSFGACGETMNSQNGKLTVVVSYDIFYVEKKERPTDCR